MLALLAISLAIVPCSSTLAAVDVGHPASLVVPELDGNRFDLATLRGKVVIINLWATWCPPCRAEMPALDAFYRRYHPQGLEMLGLSADRASDRAEVVKIMKSFTYPAAMLDDATANDFGSPAALPVTYVVGRDGVVRARLTPDQTSLTEDVLAKIVIPLLAPKAPSTGMSTTAPR